MINDFKTFPINSFETDELWCVSGLTVNCGSAVCS